MFWTDNMCIPMYAQNPKDAMTLMDYFYQPQVEAVVEYYNDYVCPVPDARLVLLNPTGWAAPELAAMRAEIGEAAVVHGGLATGVPDAGVPGQVEGLLPVPGRGRAGRLERAVRADRGQLTHARGAR